jgi:hypothetical protein
MTPTAELSMSIPFAMVLQVVLSALITGGVGSIVYLVRKTREEIADLKTGMALVSAWQIGHAKQDDDRHHDIMDEIHRVRGDYRNHHAGDAK